MWISQNRHERRLRLQRGSRSLAPQRHRFRPRLEGLEERTVLSTLTVLNTLDKGAGSLRDTITNAKSGDTIVFDPSLDGHTITLTSDQLTINKAKSGDTIVFDPSLDGPTITLTSGELAISKSLDIEGPALAC